MKILIAFQCVIFLFVSSRLNAASEDFKITGYCDFKHKTIWFKNDGKQAVFLALPGNKFSIKGVVEKDKVDIFNKIHREAWFYTCPSGHLATKNDVIIIEDLEQFLELKNDFKVILSARVMDADMKLGNLKTLTVPMKPSSIDKLALGLEFHKIK